jgi:hypothetical protein
MTATPLLMNSLSSREIGARRVRRAVARTLRFTYFG